MRYPVYSSIVYKCGGCKEKFNEADLFLEHCALTHDKVFIKKMHDKETMTKSEYVANYGPSYSCADCFKTFCTPSKLERHKMIHTGVKPFSCKICFKSFNQKIRLQNHMKTAHLQAPDKFENFKEKTQPGPVKKLAISNDGPNVCLDKLNLISDKQVEEISQMPLHQNNGLFLLQNGYKPITPKLKKRSDVTIPYPSPDSLKIFPESSKPKQNPLNHTKINAFSCNVCNKSFTKKLGLNIHECSGVAFLYSCPDCLKTFPTPSQLESHKLIHTGIKPSFCQICFKDFSQKNNLEDHICEQESGEERFDVSHLCTIIMD